MEIRRTRSRLLEREPLGKAWDPTRSATVLDLHKDIGCGQKSVWLGVAAEPHGFPGKHRDYELQTIQEGNHHHTHHRSRRSSIDDNKTNVSVSARLHSDYTGEHEGKQHLDGSSDDHNSRCISVVSDRSTVSHRRIVHRKNDSVVHHSKDSLHYIGTDPPPFEVNSLKQLFRSDRVFKCIY